MYKKLRVSLPIKPYFDAIQIIVFDFAGCLVVHTSTGMASLAAALVLGHRKNFGSSAITIPHNIPLAAIGASLLWFGWHILLLSTLVEVCLQVQ
jgi:ammonia channel protein AmtB